MQAKGICNVFNKITAENFPNLMKEMLIQVQEATKTPNIHDKNRIFPWHIIIKITSTENKKRILKNIERKIK
jgi:hypothetical protein